MPILSKYWTFLKFPKPNVVENHEMVMPIFFSFSYFDFKGHKHEKIMPGIVMRWRISIWGQTLPHFKKLKKIEPWFLKKCASDLFNVLIPGMIWSRIVICRHINISCINYSRFCPLKNKIFVCLISGNCACLFINPNC